jgi:hypothetical protein
MRTTKTAKLTTGRDRLLALLLIVALGVFVAAGLSACGGEATTDEPADGVAGSYKVETTTEEGMDAFTLTLTEDGTFTLTQPDPDGGEDIGIGGAYTVDGDAISLTNEDGSESDSGTVDGDKLVFETITWIKQ